MKNRIPYLYINYQNGNNLIGVKIITKGALEEFWQKYPDSKPHQVLWECKPGFRSTQQKTATDTGNDT